MVENERKVSKFGVGEGVIIIKIASYNNNNI